MTSSIPDTDDFYAVTIRRILLVVMFCVVMASAVVEAAYRLPDIAEMKMIWRGDGGQFPFAILSWSRHWMGGSLLAMRVPWLVMLALVIATGFFLMRRLRLRVLGPAGAAGVLGCGLLLVHDVKVVRAERHAVFELCAVAERVTAPGEQLVVDDQWMAWLLYWYGSANVRDALAVPDADSGPVWCANKSFTWLRHGEEAVLVGDTGGWFANQIREKGAAVRGSDAISPRTTEVLSRMSGEAVRVNFVTRDGSDVSSKP